MPDSPERLVTRRTYDQEYRARIAKMEKVVPETKRCHACKETKSSDDFYAMRSSRDGLQSYCIDCNKERRRGAHIKAHGLTAERFDLMVLEQDGRCAICREKPRRQGTVTWVIDHDHSCCPGQTSCGACVRGLLCNGCNRGIGLMGDDPDRLVAAAAYLMTSKGV